MNVLVFHHSRQHIYKIVEGFERYKIPHTFYTGLYYTCLNKLLQKTFPKLKKTRFSEAINPTRVKCIDTFYEIIFGLWGKTGTLMRTRNRMLFRKQLSFQKKLLRVLPKDTTHIITLHTNAFYLYPEIKKKRKNSPVLILEASQPHPGWINSVYEKYPQFYKYMPLNYTEGMLEAYSSEFEFADIIVAPSTFVKKTLVANRVAAEKIKIIFYGYNYPEVRTSDYKEKKESKKLNIAFCGILSPSKGFHFLTEVARKTAYFAEYHVFGTPINKNLLRNLPPNIRIYGFVSHDRLFEFYRHMDVFYFPTLYDASGLALLEAMSIGLVPLASPYSIAPDIIENKKNGFIIEPDRIEETVKILSTLHSDRELLYTISSRIKNDVKEISWEQYQRNYVRLIDGDA